MLFYDIRMRHEIRADQWAIKHFTRNIYSGSVAEAKSRGKDSLCKVCG